MRLQLPSCLDSRFETNAVVQLAPYIAQKFSALHRRIIQHLESTDASPEGVGWQKRNGVGADAVGYHILTGALLVMISAMLAEHEGDPKHPDYPNDDTTALDAGADIVKYISIPDRKKLRRSFDKLLLNMGLPPEEKE